MSKSAKLSSSLYLWQCFAKRSTDKSESHIQLPNVWEPAAAAALFSVFLSHKELASAPTIVQALIHFEKKKNETLVRLAGPWIQNVTIFNTCSAEHSLHLNCFDFLVIGDYSFWGLLFL